MRSDADIKRDVEDELQWDPDIDPTDIAVAVKDGVVTLTGFARSYAQKFEAEAAAKRVAGVVGVANDLEVRLPSIDERPDPDIARDAVHALRTRLPLSADNIKVIVKKGWITLEGEVEWNYQRETAENAVRWIKGVNGVSNLIQVKPRVAPSEARTAISRCRAAARARNRLARLTQAISSSRPTDTTSTESDEESSSRVAEAPRPPGWMRSR